MPWSLTAICLFMGLQLPRLIIQNCFRFRTFWSHSSFLGKGLKWELWKGQERKKHNNLSLEDHVRTLLSKAGYLKPPYLTSHGTPWKALWISRRENQEPMLTTACFPIQLCFFFRLHSPGSKGMNKQKVMVHMVHAFFKYDEPSWKKSFCNKGF